jgi:regulator of protease activity HflC (stomatin/prohibitin superfamily)
MANAAHDTPTHCLCCVTVKSGTIGVLERFGRFVGTLAPGLTCVVPCINDVRGYVSTRTQQLLLQVETKTRDSVFCGLTISVQYQIKPENAEKAYYSLANPQQQIASFVENVVRSRVADIDLDALFTSKDEIAHAVLDSIDDRMQAYGYEILATLVTDVEPDANVKQAMNKIVEAKRLQVAAEHKGEADKILRIKEAEARKAATVLDAEADSTSKRLAGEGIAAQREAIVNGLRESVSQFSEAVGVNSSEAMSLIMLTQHYDTLKDVASGSHTATLFMPYGPSAVTSLNDTIRDSFLQAKMVAGPAANLAVPAKRRGQNSSSPSHHEKSARNSDEE